LQATIDPRILRQTGSIGGFELFDFAPNGQEASVPLETRTPKNGDRSADLAEFFEDAVACTAFRIKKNK
jgi:hypothetical protein